MPLDHSPFAGRLLANETILWSGAPRRGLMLTRHDAYLIPFTLVWGGFAIFWESSVAATNAPFFMKAFGVPFVLIGLFLIFGRFPVDAWLRAKVHYAVTNRRILILRDTPFGVFQAISLNRLSDVTLAEGAEGRGTVRFGPTPAFATRGWAWIPTLDPTPQFLDVADAARVFALVQERAQFPQPGIEP